MNPFARFETIVAFRFMREGMTQTLLIVFGVALGGGVIIFMSALLAGLQANIIRRTLNYQAPIQILAPDQVARAARERTVGRGRPNPAALTATSIDRSVAEDSHRRGADSGRDRRDAGRHRSGLRAAR